MEDEHLKDKILICADCNEEFVFTVGAQKYFLEKGISEEPRRCKACYMTLKKGKRQQQKDTRKKSYATRGNGQPNGNYRSSNGRYYKG